MTSFALADLNHSGNSTTQHRIALMRRYLARFNASNVRMFLADRDLSPQRQRLCFACGWPISRSNRLIVERMTSTAP